MDLSNILIPNSAVLGDAATTNNGENREHKTILSGPNKNYVRSFSLIIIINIILLSSKYLVLLCVRE